MTADLPDAGWAVFVLFTGAVMGGAGWLTGQAVAGTWRPAWQAVAYALLLGVADRFLVYALFGGVLLSPAAYALDTALIVAVALGAWRYTRAGRMVRQYPWLYERTGPFTWRETAGRENEG